MNAFRIALILILSGVPLVASPDATPINEKRIMVDFAFYFENSGFAYNAMSLMKTGDGYEKIAVQFYSFMSSGRYDVVGYNEYIWACDLTTFCMDMSTAYRRLGATEKSIEWLELARRHAAILRPSNAQESPSQLAELDQFIVKLTAKWAAKRSEKSEPQKPIKAR
jgi:hypothetical protein